MGIRSFEMLFHGTQQGSQPWVGQSCDWTGEGAQIIVQKLNMSQFSIGEQSPKEVVEHHKSQYPIMIQPCLVYMAVSYQYVNNNSSKMLQSPLGCCKPKPKLYN